MGMVQGFDLLISALFVMVVIIAMVMVSRRREGCARQDFIVFLVAILPIPQATSSRYLFPFRTFPWLVAFVQLVHTVLLDPRFPSLVLGERLTVVSALSVSRIVRLVLLVIIVKVLVT